MKNKMLIILFILICPFTVNNLLSQNESTEKNTFPEIEMLHNKPKRMKSIYSFNNVIIKDSIAFRKLIAESHSFKPKFKIKIISDNIAKGLNLDTEKYSYYIDLVEIKNAILDPETMKLIRIK